MEEITTSSTGKTRESSGTRNIGSIVGMLSGCVCFGKMRMANGKKKRKSMPMSKLFAPFAFIMVPENALGSVLVYIILVVGTMCCTRTGSDR